MSDRTRRIALGAVLALGIALRLVGLEDPIGVRRGASWRESDVGAMARGFHREGMDPLHPRIAWRGDGPGYVESELPVVPWLVAAVWHVTGESDLTARLVVAAFGIAALFVFAGIARRTLGPPGDLAATLVFALNPLLVFLGTSLQPDPAMLLFLLLAFSALERWYTAGSERALLRAVAWLGLAVLAKASAAHLGLVLAAALLRREGLRTLLRPRTWLAAVIALAPALAWYAWARGLYATWGNSLGLSNQDHWIDVDVFTNPRFVTGLVTRQVVNVFALGGLVLAAVALLRRPRPPVVWLAGIWTLASLVFLVIAIRTTASGWAFYYHALTVGPAALLIGAGFGRIAALRPEPRAWRLGRQAGLVAALAGGAVVLGTDGLPRVLAAGLTAVAVLGAVFSYGAQPAAPQTLDGWRNRATLGALALPFLLAATVVQLAAGSLENAAVRDPDGALSAVRDCSRELAARVPPDALIVATGAAHVDEDGRQAAFDRSILFYYMDRFGFTFPSDTPDLEATLRSLREHGARWYVVADGMLADHPDFAAAAVRAEGLVAGCDTHSLVALDRVFGPVGEQAARPGVRPPAAATRAVVPAAAGPGSRRGLPPP